MADSMAGEGDWGGGTNMLGRQSLLKCYIRKGREREGKE